TNKSKLWKSHLENYTDVCRGSGRSGATLCHGGLCLRGSLARHRPTARFVHQALDTLLLKALRPSVHKAPADPDHGGNGGGRDPIGEGGEDPGSSGAPGMDGGRPLPREKRPAFRRREGDGE